MQDDPKVGPFGFVNHLDGNMMSVMSVVVADD
jgi:hypothetical protein